MITSIINTNDKLFRNIEIWELRASDVLPQYQSLDDFTNEGDFKKIGEVIRVDGTRCLNNP